MLNIDRSFWNEIVSLPESYEGPAIADDIDETSMEAETEETSSF